MIPLVERKCSHLMLPLVDINAHQVGMLPLVEGGCCHWMLPLVKINVPQGIPIIYIGDQCLTLVESGKQVLQLVDSGYQGPMDPIEKVFLPLVEIYWWKLMRV